MPFATPVRATAAPPRIEPLAQALPLIEPPAGSWSRVLHDTRFGRLLQQHGLDVLLSPAEAPTDAERYAVGLTDGDSTLRLEIAGCDHPALSMAARLPACEGMQRLAATALCAVPLRLLHALGLGRWAPTGLTRIEVRNDTHPLGPFGEPMSAWVAVRRDGRCLCLIRLGGTTVPLRRALEALIQAQPATVAAPLGWRMPGRIVLHEQVYAIALMRTLAVGDVLLMQPIPTTKTGLPVRLRWGGVGASTGRCLEAKASLRGSEMEILATPGLTADETLNDDAGADLNRPAESLDELTVPVRFEIETVTMALRELTALGPGYVIELGTPLGSATIRLVACGQVVGHAELVAVGGQLGARITHMVER
jgi:type III secretion protein Q